MLFNACFKHQSVAFHKSEINTLFKGTFEASYWPLTKTLCLESAAIDAFVINRI